MPHFGPFPAVAAVGGPGAGGTTAFFLLSDPDCTTPVTITQGAYTGTVITVNASGEAEWDHADPAVVEGYCKSGSGPRSYVRAQGAGAGAGGHTLLEDGTAVPVRSKLDFEGFAVEDDSAADTTRVVLTDSLTIETAPAGTVFAHVHVTGQPFVRPTARQDICIAWKVEDGVVVPPATAPSIGGAYPIDIVLKVMV